jgi:hypothetical protein
MSDSHFNPAFSPILGHWSMLARNLGEHLDHRAPRLGGGGATDPRLVVSAEDQRRLLHALDYWWLYASYAGVPGLPLVLAVVLLAVAVALAAAWAWTGVAAESARTSREARAA